MRPLFLRTAVALTTAFVPATALAATPEPPAPVSSSGSIPADQAAAGEPQAPTKADTSAASPVKQAVEDEDRSVYVSFSPLHLIMPFVELTGEFRAHRQIGVAAIAGFGSIKSGDSSPRFSVYEVGGQFLAYPVGHFDHGMQLGVEAIFAGVAGSQTSGNVKVAAEAQGLGVGPLVGYKFASKIGFSFNIQAGVAYYALRAQATSTTGSSATAKASDFAPILNLNLGWSF